MMLRAELPVQSDEDVIDSFGHDVSLSGSGWGAMAMDERSRPFVDTGRPLSVRNSGLSVLTVRPYQRREAHQFFHHIGYSVVVRRGLHAARRVELLERFGDTDWFGMVNISHPAAEQTQVHGVEALRAAGYLHHGQGAALGRRGMPAIWRQRWSICAFMTLAI